MKKWKGKPVTDAEYAHLWRVANPEKARAVHDVRTCYKGLRFHVDELSVEETEELRRLFSEGNWH